MKIKHIIYAILIIGFGTLVYYRISSNKEQAGAKGPSGGKGTAGTSAMQVSGVVATPQEFSSSLTLTGSIEANEQVEIRAQVSGLVRGIYFKEGSQVHKGQVLVKIDASELTAQLSQAQTRKTLAAENERRAGLLLQKEAISREEYEVAHAELKTAQALIQLVQAQLAKTSITAPFAGKVGLRAVSEGSFLSPETIITNLMNTNPIKITFAVPEKYANQVKENTEIKFTVAGSPNKLTAKIYAVEPGIESTTRTLQLRALADNSNGELLPGSFTNIELPLTVIPDALLIPTQAVVPVQNGKKIFITENGKAKEVMIETGTRTEKDLLVTSGLSAGDTVLTTGIMSLKAGSPVRVGLVK